MSNYDTDDKMGPAESFTLTLPGRNISRTELLEFIGELRYAEGPDAVVEHDDHYLVTTRSGTIFRVLARGASQHGRISIRCGRTDLSSLSSFRYAADVLGYVVVHDASGGRLPRHVMMVPGFARTLRPEVAKVLERAGLQYSYAEWITGGGTAAMFAQNERGQTVMLNVALVNFFADVNDFQESPELGYSVADTNNEFVLKYDRGLIPRSFYQGFDQSFKIINDGDFDISNITRKVFIQPNVYMLSDEARNLNRLAGGGTLADKVRPGETLDQAIKRVLREELRVAEDYVGARVDSTIEFDRDRENVLTPRLTLSIFIKPVEVSEDQRRTHQRGWSSLNKDRA